MMFIMYHKYSIFCKYLVNLEKEDTMCTYSYLGTDGVCQLSSWMTLLCLIRSRNAQRTRTTDCDGSSLRLSLCQLHTPILRGITPLRSIHLAAAVFHFIHSHDDDLFVRVLLRQTVVVHAAAAGCWTQQQHACRPCTFFLSTSWNACCNSKIQTQNTYNIHAYG